MLRYGFEREFVLCKGDVAPVEVPKELQSFADGCGYLVEARGDHSESLLKALGNLWAAEIALLHAVWKHGYKLMQESKIDVTPKFLRQLRTTRGKNPNTTQSLRFPLKPGWSVPGTVGLHVHFSDTRIDTDTTNVNGVAYTRERTTHRVLNIPYMIAILDHAFAKQIAEARRPPGLYRMKRYGFEYRSLPGTLSSGYLSEVFMNILPKLQQGLVN